MLAAGLLYGDGSCSNVATVQVLLTAVVISDIKEAVQEFVESFLIRMAEVFSLS